MTSMPTMSQPHRPLRFRTDPRDRGAVFVSDADRDRGTLSVAIFRPGNCSFDRPAMCEHAMIAGSDSDITLTWTCEHEGVTAAVQLQRHAHGYAGKFTARGIGRAVVRLIWALPHDATGFAFVPSFMYGDNAGGRSPWSQCPQLSDRAMVDFARPWVSSQWHVRTDRSSHGMTSLIASDHAYALGGRDVCRYDDAGVAEKTGLGTGSAVPVRLCFSLGFANIPHTYCAVPGRNHVSRPEGYIDLDRGPVTADLFMLAQSHTSRHAAASHLLRSAYMMLHDGNDHPPSADKDVAAIADALIEYGYCSRAINFRSTFTTTRHNPVHDAYFASGWAGGAQVAYPLLAAGRRFDQPDWLAPARAVLDNIAHHAINPNANLFFDNFDLTRHQWNTHGWWYDALEHPGHSGYVNGQVCYYLLKAYALEQRHGGAAAHWLDSATRVLKHVMATATDQGGFGYTYDERDGRILDPDGFSGAWFIPALVLLHNITGDKPALAAATRAMDGYRRAIENFNVYGGPHDIFKSPDSEGILAWIRAAHLLHETTGDEQFLADLIMGIEYELSWKFAYNVVHEHDPLKAMNWRTVGGSVTSINNPHIHPMNSMVTSSLRYAADRTGDAYLHARLADTLAWTSSIIMRRDGQFDWGKRGMINERYCHSDALLLERYPDGRPASTWFCGHSWASGSVLEAILD